MEQKVVFIAMNVQILDRLEACQTDEFPIEFVFQSPMAFKDRIATANNTETFSPSKMEGHRGIISVV